MYNQSFESKHNCKCVAPSLLGATRSNWRLVLSMRRRIVDARLSLFFSSSKTQYTGCIVDCGGRFPILYKNLVVILLSGATGRKQPTFQRRPTVRWSQFEAAGGQLSATGGIIFLSLSSVQVLKIIYMGLFVSRLFLSLCRRIIFVSLSEDHFCLFHRSKF